MLALFACSSEKAAETGPVSPAATGGAAVAGKNIAQYSLEVVPANADKKSTMATIARGFSETTTKIEWLVNGAPAGSGNIFRPVQAARGDFIQAKAIVAGQEIASNIVQLRNTPPEMTKVKIMPEVFKPGDKLYVDTEAKDADGDSVTIFYEWTKNGETAGRDKEIEGTVKRGDKIFVKITPFDGQAYGVPITMTREFMNMPPAIAADTKYIFDGVHFSYQVKASDPDGDALTYAVKDGPKGMTIDPVKGLVSWDVPEDFVGKTAFTVTADDGHGGMASYTANITIRSVE